jgi:hypothetical protein
MPSQNDRLMRGVVAAWRGFCFFLTQRIKDYE